MGPLQIRASPKEDDTGSHYKPAIIMKTTTTKLKSYQSFAFTPKTATLNFRQRGFAFNFWIKFEKVKKKL